MTTHGTAAAGMDLALADPAAVVSGDTWRVTVLTEGLLRLEFAADGVFEDRPSTFAVRRRLPVPAFRVEEAGGHLQVTTSRLRLTYDRKPFSTSGLFVEVLGGITSYHSVWRFGQDAPTLGGTVRTLDNVDGRVPLEPGVVSRQGYAVLDDSRSMVVTADGWVAPRDGSRLDLYVFAYGRDHAQALQAFHAVSGPAPVVPRWALGNWWSRYHRYTEAEYEDLLDRFRAEGLPFSVAVLDMDWHVTDLPPEHGSGWTGWTWNRDLFPDPPGFLAAVHDRGLRVTLNVHPADGVQAYEDAYPAMCRALGRDPASNEPILFDVTDRAFMTAYLEVLHRGLEEQGVDFWWIDWQSGPYSRIAGVDPLWMLNRLHFLDATRDGRRGIVFSRYAGPGSHRYPIGFSGDTVISWDSLAFQPEFTAAAADIGYGWWSHDIGGHFFGRKDDELATRWLQLGVFSPILRLHSTADPFLTKEPWTFGPLARAVQTEHLRLRHRLVPYLHSLNHATAASGCAIVRPLYHRWPAAREAYQHRTQFAFGPDLLVAPVVTPADPRAGVAAVSAWLPPGTWTDLFTDLVYDGDREVVLHRDLSTIPVLARAGAVVPLDGQAVPVNDPVNPEHLEVLVVVGADGSFELVEDDGTDAGVVRTPLRWDDGAGALTVGPAQGALGAVPARRRWTLTLVGAAPAEGPARASVDGATADVVAGRSGRRLSLTVEAVPAAATLELRLAAPPRRADPDVAGRVYALLDAAQVEYAAKGRGHAAVTAAAPLHVRLSRLRAAGLDPVLHAAVEEIVLATASGS